MGENKIFKNDSNRDEIVQHFTMYLDESGDHLLYSEEEYIENSLLETHCSLLGFVIPNNNKEIIKSLIKELKCKLWNTEDVIFHSVKIRHKQGPFAIFHYKSELYSEFKLQMNELIKASNPKIICCSLNKRVWIRKYPRKYYFKDDPYEQAFVFLLERYAGFLNNQFSKNVIGKISVEKRGSAKDKSLKRTYEWIKNHGTQYKNKDYFKHLADQIDFDNKNYNIAGLQLSDYCSYPFYKNHKFPDQDNKLYAILQPYIYAHKKWPTDD